MNSEIEELKERCSIVEENISNAFQDLSRLYNEYIILRTGYHLLRDRILELEKKNGG